MKIIVFAISMVALPWVMPAKAGCETSLNSEIKLQCLAKENAIKQRLADQNETAEFPVYDIETFCAKYYPSSIALQNACIARAQVGYYKAQEDWEFAPDSVRRRCKVVAHENDQPWKYDILQYCIHPDAEMARLKRLNEVRQKFRY